MNEKHEAIISDALLEAIYNEVDSALNDDQDPEPRQIDKLLSSAKKKLIDNQSLPKSIGQVYEALQQNGLDEEHAELLGHLAATSVAFELAILLQEKGQTKFKLANADTSYENRTLKAYFNQLQVILPKKIMDWYDKEINSDVPELINEIHKTVNDLNKKLNNEWKPSSLATQYAITHLRELIDTLMEISLTGDEKEKDSKLNQFVLKESNQILKLNGQLLGDKQNLSVINDILQQFENYRVQVAPFHYIIGQVTDGDLAQLKLCAIAVRYLVTETAMISNQYLFVLMSEFYEQINISKTLSAQEVEQFIQATPQIFRFKMHGITLLELSLAFKTDSRNIFENIDQGLPDTPLRQYLIRELFQLISASSPSNQEAFIEFVEEHIETHSSGYERQLVIELCQEYRNRANNKSASARQLQINSFANFLSQVSAQSNEEINDCVDDAGYDDIAKTNCM